jgi:hypothetical protein
MYNERNRQNNWYVWYRVRAEKKDIFPIWCGEDIAKKKIQVYVGLVCQLAD